MNSTTIFNRWGEVVFKTNFSNAWDGRLSSGQLAPDGTYYYFIDINAYDNGIFTQKSTREIYLYLDKLPHLRNN